MARVFYVVAVVTLTLLLHVLAQTNTCSDKNYISIVANATVKFTVIRTIRESKMTPSGLTCSDTLNIKAVQNVALIQWLLDRMNNNGYINGVTIGADVYDDCGIARHSLSRALDVVDGPVLGTSRCETSSQPCHIGILGGSNTDTTEAILYGVRDSSVVVISPYASSVSLTNRQNFYRTVHSDFLYIQAIVTFLEEQKLNYVAVVYVNTTFGREMASKLKSHAKSRGICVDVTGAITTGSEINFAPFNNQRSRTKDKTLRIVFLGNRTQLAKMMIQLQLPPSPTNISWIIPDIEQQSEEQSSTYNFVGKDGIILTPETVSVAEANSYIQHKWQQVIDGKPLVDDVDQLMSATKETSVPALMDTHVQSTIDAVFVFLSSLGRQRAFYCKTNHTVCTDLKSSFNLSRKEIYNHSVVYRQQPANITITEFSDSLREVAFDEAGDIKANDNDNIFSVKLRNGTVTTKIGNFRNGSFVFNSSVSGISFDTSKCNNSCPMCIDNTEVPFAYIHGDALLLGIVSMHETDPSDPFQCSQFRTEQMDVMILETFLNTVDKMRNSTGINFGAVVIDDCYSSARTVLVLSKLFNKDIILRSTGENAQEIDFQKVVAVINVVASNVNIQIALLMAELNIPIISASASSPDLDDRGNFPYFLRTVPSDVDQANAMVEIVKTFGWKYVSVLYTENNYGSKGSSAFIEQAQKNGICIAEQPRGILDVADNSTVNALAAVLQEIEKQNSDVVVYFGTEARIVDFLKEINVNRNFIFIGSEDWGNRQYILDIPAAGNAAKGSITMRNQFRSAVVDIVNLTEYIRQLNPQNNSRNPWFAEYWEEIFRCDLSQSFANKYDDQCEGHLTFSDEFINEIRSDHRIAHVITAVMATCQGLVKAKEKYCKFSAFPCDQYFTYMDQVVNDLVKHQSVDGVGVFKDNGNGNIGFIINNVQEVNGKMDYIEVGTYEGSLNLQKHKINFYLTIDGSCPAGKCDHWCNKSISDPVATTTPTHAHPVDNEFSVPEYSIIGILAFLLVVIIIFFVIIICCLRKRLIELQYELKKTAREMRTAEYISSRNMGSSLNDIQNDVLTYPDMNFANSGSPSGETFYDLQKTQQYLDKKRSNGFVNGGFQGDLYIHPRSDERHNDSNTSTANLINDSAHSTHAQSVTQSSPNIQSSSDSPDAYKPKSKSHYGLSTHSSFKKPSDYQSHKVQPRTQLAVPPCRPELPPRETQNRPNGHAKRPQNFPDNFNEVSVPKERARKVRSNPKRLMTSSQNGSSTDSGSHHKNMDDADSPRYTGSHQALNFKPDYLISPEHAVIQPDMINFHGSMEKISRV